MFPSDRQVAYALLTSPPLTASKVNFRLSSFDLHVLCAPPAFILSQDQTLYFWYLYFFHLLKVINLNLKFSQALLTSFFFLEKLLKFLVLLYRFGFSLKDFCLFFNVLFMFPYVLERFALYYTFFTLSTLFDNFFKLFSHYF